MEHLKAKGGGFVIEPALTDQVMTPEDITEEQKMIVETTRQFFTEEVRPVEDQLESLDYELTVKLMRQAGELGLLGTDVPEQFGGLGLDKVTGTYIAETLSRSTSFSLSIGAHTGIGTLPIVFFGTKEQKRKYLPELATGEKVAAYCLTEPSSGSDALGAKTTATLSADGKHYILNGSKIFITNAGFADIFIVYAKIDGQHFSAFIVEKGLPGFTLGPEEKKMGIKASSTRPLYFDNVPVPVENLLGEPGKGHLIAFNILNIGRFKLAAGCLGSCKEAIEVSAKYANTRTQFSTPIARFPLIGKKLAEMNIATYAVESVLYRTSGLLDDNLKNIDHSSENAGSDSAKAIAEFAIECSINKVFASEGLDFVADEGVQIHGGYGYIQEYVIERIYRDSRINRIFEGTNEINRLIIPGTLVKKAMRGELPLLQQMETLKKELEQYVAPQTFGEVLEEETHLVNMARKVALAALGLAVQHYGDKLDKEQEIMANLADMMIQLYAMESVLLRTKKMIAASGADKSRNAVQMTQVFVHETIEKIHSWAKQAICAASGNESPLGQLSLLTKLLACRPVNTTGLKREIAGRVVKSEKYVV